MIDAPMTLNLAFGLPGHTEWLVLLVLGLLIFGRRLPEVGRSIGRSIVEFKKGIKGIEDEIESESSKPAQKQVEGDSPEYRPLPDETIGGHAAVTPSAEEARPSTES